MANLPRAGERSSASFLDALGALAPSVNQLIEALKRSKSIANARLACKALRELIDGNIEEIQLTIEGTMTRLWPRTPCLTRWPNCRSVILNLSNSLAKTGLGSVASMAGLPFTNLTPAARGQITKLIVTVTPGWEGGAVSSDAAVPLLVGLLPRLRVLDLRGLGDLSCEPLMQHILYTTLASLPDLEELGLPSRRLLDGIGALATAPNLRRLRVSDQPSTNTNLTYAGLAQLPHLEELSLFGFLYLADPEQQQQELGFELALQQRSTIDFTRLLDSLPPSLQCLSTAVSGMPGTTAVGLWLRGGRLEQVWLTTLSCPPVEVQGALTVDLASRLAAQLLGSDRAMPVGHHLQLLSLETLGVPRGARLDGDGLQPLRNLLARSRRVHVEQLHVAEAGAAVPVLDLLGRLPDYLVLRAALQTGRRQSVWLVPRGRGPEAAAAGAGADADAEARWVLGGRAEKERLGEMLEKVRVLGTPQVGGPERRKLYWRQRWQYHGQRKLRWEQLLQQHQQQQGGPGGAAAGGGAAAAAAAAPPPYPPAPTVDQLKERVLHVMTGPAPPLAVAEAEADPVPWLRLLRGSQITMLSGEPQSLNLYLRALWQRALNRLPPSVAADFPNSHYTLTILPGIMRSVLVGCGAAELTTVFDVEVAATASEQVANFMETVPVFQAPRLVDQEGEEGPRTYLAAVEQALQEQLDQLAAAAAGAPGGAAAAAAVPGGPAPIDRPWMLRLMEAAARLCESDVQDQPGDHPVAMAFAVGLAAVGLAPVGLPQVAGGDSDSDEDMW